MQIVFVHGWGYDPSLWQALVTTLHEFSHHHVDLGYYGPAQIPNLNPTEPILAVGHSLGVLWLLTQENIRWQKLVAINGFSRFSYHKTFMHGTDPRILTRMHKRCTTMPRETLDEFRLRCGGEPSHRTPSQQALLSGLDVLTHGDGRTLLSTRANDIWALSAEDDPIVSSAHSHESFSPLPADHFCITPTGGHMLPITATKTCADFIRTAARS